MSQPKTIPSQQQLWAELERMVLGDSPVLTQVTQLGPRNRVFPGVYSKQPVKVGTMIGRGPGRLIGVFGNL